jgi:hypothetical protein
VGAPAASWCVSHALVQIKEEVRGSLTLLKIGAHSRIQRAFFAWLDESALKLVQQRPAPLPTVRTYGVTGLRYSCAAVASKLVTSRAPGEKQIATRADASEWLTDAVQWATSQGSSLRLVELRYLPLSLGRCLPDAQIHTRTGLGDLNRVPIPTPHEPARDPLSDRVSVL